MCFFYGKSLKKIPTCTTKYVHEYIVWSLFFAFVSLQNLRIFSSCQLLVLEIFWEKKQTSKEYFISEEYEYLTVYIPWCFNSCNEKLRSIGIFSTIGHGKNKSLVFQDKVFIGKSGSINAKGL